MTTPKGIAGSASPTEETTASTVKLLFSGDLCVSNRVARMLANDDVAGAFGDTRHCFAESDIAIVNLESPLSQSQRPLAKLGPNFQGPPAAARALKSAGIDVCCLANNHILDYGETGLAQTLRHLKAAGLRHTGAAMNPKKADAPLRIQARGIRIALINAAIVEGALPLDACSVARLDPLALRRAVARERKRTDIVIPVLHAGREEVLVPSPGLQALARELVEAGAAAVVCHHPHTPQGIETYRGCPIAYSLGNFLFDWPDPEPHTDTAFLLELHLSNTGVSGMRLHPFRKSATGGAELLRGAEKQAYLQFVRDLSTPLRRPDEFRGLWREQCRPQLSAYYAKRLARGADVLTRDADARLKAQLTFLNVMEDLEHGETIKEALRAEALGLKRNRQARRQLDAWRERLVGFAKRKPERVPN